MSYVGNKPALNYVNLAVQHFSTSATATYTLNQSVSDEVDIALFINNVRQQPGSSYAYTASGTTLTLSQATAGSDTMYCVFLGKAVETVNPPAGSVNTSELVDNAVTTAKITSDSVTYDKIQDLGSANRVLGGASTGTVGEVQVVDGMTNFVSTSSAAGLQIKGDGTTDGYLQLNCSQNSHGIKLKSPAHSAGASYTLTFPTTDGNSAQFLQTNGSGVLTWADVSTGFSLGTPVATTSGSYIDFTGIPSTAKLIILNMQLVSLSGSDHIRIQIGDSGGVETSGYDCGLGEIGSSSTQAITNGLPMYLAQSGRAMSSTVFITLSNSSTNLYNLSSVNYRKDSAQMQISQGFKTLSAVLDRVRIETTGSDTFDAGNANIMYL